jgi:hypothetical protein
MITEDRLQKALTYLATTDEAVAQARTDMERAEFKAKTIKDAMFKRLDGSVADRQAEAGASPEYSAAMDEYFARLFEFEAIKNKRATEAIVVDTWRSLNAARRQGNI